MRPLNGVFPTEDFPALIVGLAAPDDSAVYQLDAERALISTVDFFPPVVDDPYDFGAIAAANALSDVYAMGGEPLMAINLVAFPDDLDLSILGEILMGGAEKVREADAAIAGGHTVTDEEPKYGLAVTGIIHPGRVLRKGGAQPGDRLILTKPLGTGVITTALKSGRAAEAHVRGAVASMSRLNKSASRLAQQMGVRAMTDITGFGLLGHAHEMAHVAAVDFTIAYGAVAWLPGARQYAAQAMFPGGMFRNRDYFSTWIRFDEQLDEIDQNLLFDPETSGGLLMAVASEKAASLCRALVSEGDPASIVGEVLPGSGSISVTL